MKNDGKIRLLKISLIALAFLIGALLVKDYFSKSLTGETETAYVVEIGNALGKGFKAIGTTMGKIGTAVGNFASNTVERIKIFYEEQRLKHAKDAPAIEEIEAYTPGNEIEEFVDTGEIMNSTDNSGLTTIRLKEGMAIVSNEENVRYLAFKTGIDSSGMELVRYLTLPSEVEGVIFRPVNDVVYAKELVSLNLSPTLRGTVAGDTEIWGEYIRTGISSDGIYQLVNRNKQIVYSRGNFFSRQKENISLTEDYVLPKERVEISMKLIRQNPELPNGCEVTSLAMVLDYWGYKVSKTDLSEKYLPKKEVGKANFYEEFVGDPASKTGYGCYAPVILKTANSYLEEHKSKYRAYNYSGRDFSFVIDRVKSGIPVIVWASSYMNEEPRFTTGWVVDGESLEWKSNMHCLVVSGYDGNKNTVITYDPLYGVEEYDFELFLKRFKQYYSQIICIETE